MYILTTKIIFLDFDGVLNSTPFLEREGWFEGPLTQREHKFRCEHASSNVDVSDLRMIDRTKVILLNQIIEKTGAKVVISSSWRLGRNVDDLIDALEYHGFVGEVTSMTPELCGAIRGEEISEWMYDAMLLPGEDITFVILDDDDDMGTLRGNLVKTSMKYGLTPYDVERAIMMLNKNDDN